MTALQRFHHYCFLRYRARKAALKLRRHLPFLGMVEQEKLVLAAQSRTSGLVYISGFGIPRVEYELFVASKDGWTPKKVSLLITKTGDLEQETEEGMQPLAFDNELARPAVEVLKLIEAGFPFTHYNTSTPQQLEERRPKLKG